MLVGREPERQAVATVLAAARVADSRALVLVGEAGIGKTALLQEARSMAEGMRVLDAQGVDTERLVPFAGLLQVLRPVLGLLEDIPAAQRTALGSALALGAEPAREPSRFAIGAATLSLLTRAAEDRPLVVLVDDAHLLDVPSAEALVFAARRMLSDAVAVLMALRPEEPGARALDPLPALQVEGLDVAAAGSLLATPVGDASALERLQRLHRVTAGNPLAMLELHEQVDRLEDLPPSAPVPVPEQVARSFLRRVSVLPLPVRSTLVVASADPGSLRAVLRAARRLGIADPTLVPAQDAGLVTLVGDAVVFRHPLVQAAVYADADPAMRRAVHRVLALELDGTEVHRLTWHLSEGAEGPDETTSSLLQQVAVQAAGRGAHTIAMHAHERAAALTLDPDLVPHRLADAGEAAWLAGRTDRATELLAEALDARPTALLRARIQELQGEVQLRAGSLDTALHILTGAASAVAPLDADRAVRINAEVVDASLYLLDSAAAMSACSRIDQLLAGDVSPATRLLGRSASGMAMVIAGAGEDGMRRLREAAYRLVEPEAPESDRFRLPLRLHGALWLRDGGHEREVVATSLQSMREDATVALLPYLLMQVARDAFASNRWDLADSTYHEAARLAQELGLTTDLAACVAGWSMVDARRGRSAAVAAHVEAVAELAARNGVRLATAWLGFAQGDLAAGAGDLERALVHYEALEDLLAATAMKDPDQSCAPELVECLVHLRRRAQAARVARGFSARAASKGQSWSLARSARANALCADEPEPAFLEALALHARTPDSYEAARTRLAYGAWLRRVRRRVDARTVLRSALVVFDSLDAGPWADRAAQELAATGETVQRSPDGVRVDLTPQERQIAQLLAEGRTTRQAAAGLFLSPKTVEYHLRHIYLKLGISSRAELTQWFDPPR